MNDEDRRIVKENTGKFIVVFSKLGDYEDLDYDFDTYEEAEAELVKLQSRYKNYYGYVAQILKVVRESE